MLQSRVLCEQLENGKTYQYTFKEDRILYTKGFYKSFFTSEGF